MSNLVGNAVQHGARGETISVSIRGQDAIVGIDVHNAGRAIPRAALDRVFEPLYRTDDTIDDKRTHLGLGLHIARTIALAHGGDITVASTEDGGTTFEVRLPREPDELET